MLTILNWIFFGIIVAWIARNLIGIKSRGILHDVFIAVCGSFIAGTIN